MHAERGFTLIELMITLAVAAILLTLAIGGWQSVVQSNRATSRVNQLLSSVQFARSEAIKRAARVSVCATSNPTRNNPTCGGTWQQGWLVFVNDPATAVNQFDPPGDILVGRGVPSGGDLTISHSSPSVLTFDSQGFPSGTTGSTAPSSFYLCDSRRLSSDDHVRVIDVTPTGRAAVRGLRPSETPICP